jgi:crotonobetainyl-CoA:carnitine CoA-transferase CaiB-like acyl-CoA transferase
MPIYDATLNRYIRGDTFGGTEGYLPALLASAARTTTGVGTGIYVPQYDMAVLTLVISAVSGTTPNLTVSIDTSPDNSTWTAIAAFAAQTTTTAGVRKIFSGVDNWIRASWTITGTTPSFTFTVTGIAK